MLNRTKCLGAKTMSKIENLLWRLLLNPVREWLRDSLDMCAITNKRIKIKTEKDL